MNRARLYLVVGTGFLALAASGCAGTGGPKVTGAVTLDGQSLADAQVIFEPVRRRSGLGGGAARTGPDGRFEIRPHPRTGQTLKPGKYVVVITKLVDRNGSVPSPEEFAQLEAAHLLRNLLPSRYNDRAFSEFKVEIKEGDNDLKTLALKSK
jgi:hypothetical protein